MKTLIGTVGLPRSGKSTWARKQGHPVVNPDSIRLALYGQAFIPDAEKMVWTIAHYMVSSLFIAGHDTVILDATNTVPQVRQQWMGKDWDCRWVVFWADKVTCLARAEASGQPYLIPVIDDMANQWDISDIPFCNLSGL